jgi:hypothetical protein
MGERQAYYDRRRLGTEEPMRYFSSISDGMAQSHNELPWRGNLASFPIKLECHLQGVLVHGKHLLLYRTLGLEMRLFLA